MAANGQAAQDGLANDVAVLPLLKGLAVPIAVPVAIPIAPWSVQQTVAAQPDVWPGGRGVAVTVNPANSSIAIVASESGGLFQTHDRGVNWLHVDSLPPFRLSDVKYDPANQDIVVVTARGDSHVANGGGIWRSINGGATWEQPPGATPPAGAKCPEWASAYGIAFEPNSANVYVGTDCGVAISRDHGATWSYMTPAANSPRIRAVLAHTGGGVDACGDGGLYRSTTGGNTWSAAMLVGGGGCTQGGVHLIAGSPLHANVLFATPSPTNLFESDDGGRTWVNLNPPAPQNGRPSWVHAAKAADGNPGHFDLWHGYPYRVVHQTCAQGATPECAGPWIASAVDGSWEPNDLAFAPPGDAPLFLVLDSGLYTTSDGGATFVKIGGGQHGYDALQLYDIAGQIHPDHTDLYFGSQDNCIWASGDDGVTWSTPRCFDGFNLQMKRVTASDANQTITGVLIGTGNFKTSAHLVASGSWNSPPGGSGFNPFIIDTGVYFQYGTVAGTPGIVPYLTIDGGTTWNPVMRQGGAGPLAITAGLSHWPQIVGPPGTPTVYQAVTKPGMQSNGDPILGLVRLDIDVAASTGRLSAADLGLVSLGDFALGQGTFVVPTVFGADPFDPRHVIAPDAGDSTMKATRDGGNSWTADGALTELVTNRGIFRFNIPVTANPPEGAALQVHAIAFDPDIADHILVGTEAGGVLQSTDGGHSWGRVPFSGVFIRGVSDFFFDRDSVVYVATYGHGLWQLTPQEFPLAQSSSLGAKLPAHLAETVGPGAQPAPGQNQPYLRLVGTIPVTGQTDAHPGDTVVVYGNGFCANTGCSPVRLTVGERVAVKEIKVNPDGSFETTFAVTEAPGHYPVTAWQRSAKGETLRDVKMLMVPAGD
jgi:photosystem II stability/assembly factor-like uncharacterized protein